MRRRIMMLGLVSGLAAGPAGAALGQGEDDALLGGPPVEVEAATPTLVERDYEGKLRELDVRAEVAAIGLLGLTDAEREDVDALIQQRAALADQVVFENLELIVQLQSVMNAGEPGQRGRGGGAGRELFMQMIEALAPMRAQEPLVDHLADALPASVHGQYRAIVAEWYEAQASEASGDARERRRGRMGGRLGAMRTELRAAYERGVADRTQRIDDLIARLDLTPEQEGEVRRMITDFTQKTGGEPTEAQRAELFRQILGTLGPEQRRKALESIRRERG